jgi:hypothetical protein
MVDPASFTLQSTLNHSLLHRISSHALPLINLVLPLNPYSTRKAIITHQLFMWEKRRAVGFVGFKSGFARALIDSRESFTVLLGQAGLTTMQHIIWNVNLLRIRPDFRGGECPTIWCKLFVIFVFYTNPFRCYLPNITHPQSHPQPKHSYQRKEPL